MDKKRKRKDKEVKSTALTPVSEDQINERLKSGRNVSKKTKKIRKSKIKQIEEINMTTTATATTSTAGGGGKTQHTDTQPNPTTHRKKKKKKETKITPRATNESLITECLTATITSNGHVVAALLPGTTLYLQGCLVLRPLIGRVEVVGCVVEEGEKQAMFSLPSASLLGVQVVMGRKVQGGSGCLAGLPSAWVKQLLDVVKNREVSLVSFRPQPCRALEFLVRVGWQSLGRVTRSQVPWSEVGASMVTPRQAGTVPVLHVVPEWRQAVQDVVKKWERGKVPRVVVCGGKGVGKSTLFKYTVNTLLSDGRGRGVLCVDLDPGQPELSLPASISLTHLTRPLLGPAYTHRLDQGCQYRRQVLVGAVNTQLVLQRYLSAVEDVCVECSGRGWSGVPVVVNTMGWVQGTGVGIMVDVLRLVQPTYVMQIQGAKPSRNYPFHLDGLAVHGRGRGIITVPGVRAMKYCLVVLGRARVVQPNTHLANPASLRALRVLAEAGRAMEHGYRVALPWAGLALHVCVEQVPRNRILQVLNGQLVALCQVEPGSLHTVQDNLPQTLGQGADFGDLLGWAVVEGVDPLAGTIHLATTLAPHTVVEQVNAIIMPRVHLPDAFYTRFNVGRAPYLEQSVREGVARLTVGRQIKPRHSFR